LPSNDVDFFVNGQPEVKKQYNAFAADGGMGPYGYMMRPESGVTAIAPAPIQITPELTK
jgi:pilus assembly protein CpaC